MSLTTSDCSFSSARLIYDLCFILLMSTPRSAIIIISSLSFLAYSLICSWKFFVFIFAFTNTSCFFCVSVLSVFLAACFLLSQTFFPRFTGDAEI